MADWDPTAGDVSTPDESPTVVSTSPSGTEICCALGVEPAVVSGSCDHPPSITDRPRLDRSRVSGETSVARDAQATSSEAIYAVDDELLRTVAPDLILTQRVCGVCAVDEGRIRQHLRASDGDPQVLGLEADTLESVLDCVREVGAALDRKDRAEALVGELRTSFDAIERYTATAETRPRVVVFEWLDPLHVAANWVPELVERTGGRYPLAEPGERSIEVEWDLVVDAEPDVLVLAPCGYSIEDARSGVDALTSRPGWDELPAVREDRVYAIDGGALNRWTPRLAGECERLATVIHPDHFDGEPLATRL